jgi:phosphatidylethanolamine/phosphatidyl-N-methylethanolamine N-methyltransferase
MPKTYDQFAPQYDAVMRPLERWFLTRLRLQTFNLLPKHARILELGAGTGRNFVFYPPDASGVASEPSREMLKIARDRKRPGAVSLVQSHAEDLPFKSEVFDAAFATLVFCSVKSPARSFAELRRVVRSGGTVLLLEHVRPAGLLGSIFDVINMATVPLFEDHWNRRTADDARAAGLDVLQVQQSLRGVINLITCRV